METAITNRRRLFEIIMVILTGVGKIVFTDLLDVKFVYIVTAVLFWVVYFIHRTRKHRGLIRYWGLSFSNARETFIITGIAAAIVLLLLLGYWFFYGRLALDLDIVFVLLTYPLWGLVQQFLMMSLFAGNLKDLNGMRLPAVGIVLFTSILFSMVHYPSFLLIAATFVMAIFYTILFLIKRNIIALGLFHGILGGIFYAVVLHRDAWMEFTRMLNN